MVRTDWRRQEHRATWSINYRAETAKILVLQEVKERLAADGADAVGNRPQEFAAYIKAEIDKWSKVVKAGGITLE